jgi:hypothetical protein
LPSTQAVASNPNADSAKLQLSAALKMAGRTLSSMEEVCRKDQAG